MKIKKQIYAILLAFVGLSMASAQQGAPRHGSVPEGSMQIDHVAIYVTDLKRSVDFYHEVFGFQRVAMPVTFAAWLSMGHGVMLHVVAGRKEPVSNSKWDHLSFACEDMDVMTAMLDGKHIHWESMEGKPAPAVRFDGVKQIFIKDPDGYWIEVNDVAKKKGSM